MSSHIISQLEIFLEKNPEIEMFEVILPDLGGNLRGKWIARNKLHKVFNGGLKLPLSTLSLDVWGRDVESLVFETGDGDGICRPDITTLAAAPWKKRPTGQILLSLDEISGEPCAYDPRHIVTRLTDRLAGLGLKPMLATEMEFYLLKEENNGIGQPLHTQTDITGGKLNSGQTYSLELMEDMSEFMHAVRDASEIQGLPVDTLIKEAAPSQYEINLYHCDNALRGADQAVMLQRLIKGVAKQHGMRATFMAKPFGHLAGNGKHVHCSLVDSDGNNAFNNNTAQGNDLLRNAIAGCLASMADSMLMFAPNLNSYRRFQNASHAPSTPTWGYENRTVSIRVPADSYEAMRIEHRVAGADANSHLVIAAILAGMLYGIENKLEAPEPISGNAYNLGGQQLPRYCHQALQSFSESEFIEEYFGDQFREKFSSLKQQEIDEYDGFVTPLEYQANL